MKVRNDRTKKDNRIERMKGRKEETRKQELQNGRKQIGRESVTERWGEERERERGGGGVS